MRRAIAGAVLALLLAVPAAGHEETSVADWVDGIVPLGEELVGLGELAADAAWPELEVESLAVADRLSAHLIATQPAACYEGAWVAGWRLYSDLHRLAGATNARLASRYLDWVDADSGTILDETLVCPVPE